MAALVTGASGLVGRHLVQRLLEHGRPVRALSRRPPADGPAARAQWCSVDVNDEAALIAAMAGIAIVYHVAAVVPARGRNGMWQTNVDGTGNVARACVRAGVHRLVLVSSVAAYRTPLDDVVSEAAPIGGSDLYGRSKAQAEAAASQICRQAMELVIVRPCQIYGPGDASGYTRRLLGLSASPLLPVAGWRARAFSLIHVHDVVAALQAAGEESAAAAGIFNVAPPSRVTLTELAHIHAALRRERSGLRVPIPAPVLRTALCLRSMAIGRAPVGARPWRSYAVGHNHGSLLLGGPLYDSSRARAVLDFSAQTTPERGWSDLLAPTALA
jgi:nucleoside-diphosphate-sugar epimerase